jgi:hypothetical protein
MRERAIDQPRAALGHQWVFGGSFRLIPPYSAFLCRLIPPHCGRAARLHPPRMTHPTVPGIVLGEKTIGFGFVPMEQIPQHVEDLKANDFRQLMVVSSEEVGLPHDHARRGPSGDEAELSHLLLLTQTIWQMVLPVLATADHQAALGAAIGRRSDHNIVITSSSRRVIVRR